METKPMGKFEKIDEGVYEDEQGAIYEQYAPGKFRQTRAAPAAASGDRAGSAIVAVPAFVGASDLLVRPEVDIEAAKTVWKAYKDFRLYVLEDPECFDKIGDTKEMNRTGATRLAVPFGLSIEERAVEEALIGDDRRFIVHVRVSKGRRFVDGVGTCRISEIREGKDSSLSQREHFAYTKAWTRAVKRAIADILGGTEAG